MSKYTTAGGILVEQILQKLSDQTPESQSETAELIFKGVMRGYGVKIEDKKQETIVEQKSPRVEG